MLIKSSGESLLFFIGFILIIRLGLNNTPEADNESVSEQWTLFTSSSTSDQQLVDYLPPSTIL